MDVMFRVKVADFLGIRGMSSPMCTTAGAPCAAGPAPAPNPGCRGFSEGSGTDALQPSRRRSISTPTLAASG